MFWCLQTEGRTLLRTHDQEWNKNQEVRIEPSIPFWRVTYEGFRQGFDHQKSPCHSEGVWMYKFMPFAFCKKGRWMNDTCGGNGKTCENKPTHKPNPRIAPKLGAILLVLATGIRCHHNISQPLFLHCCNRKPDHAKTTLMSTREIERFHLDGTSPQISANDFRWGHSAPGKQIIPLQVNKYIDIITLHNRLSACECVASCDFSTRLVQAISDEQCRPSSKITKKTCKRRTSCKFCNIFNIALYSQYIIYIYIYVDQDLIICFVSRFSFRTI